jgi:hypothetical protein
LRQLFLKVAIEVSLSDNFLVVHARLNRRRVIILYVIAGEGLRFKRTVEINLMIKKR